MSTCGPIWLICAFAIGVPAVGIGLALAGGPWEILVVAHLGALAYWRWGMRLPWRGLLASQGRHSTLALVAAGVVVPAAMRIIDDLMTGSLALGVLVASDPATIAQALCLAVLIGGFVNAIPEELTRYVLLTAFRGRWGEVVAVVGTAAWFVLMHVPTWLSAGMTGSTWVYQIVSKLAFGLVVAWSAVRLGSIGFALGYHLGGNVVGVALDNLASSQGWAGLTAVNVVVLTVETAVCAVMVVVLSRVGTTRPRAPRRPGSWPGRPDWSGRPD